MFLVFCCCVFFFPQWPNSFSLLFPLETKMYFAQFPLDCLFFLRRIAINIKYFFHLFIQFYMVLSDKCRMKGKRNLTTMLLNNRDLWIPAPLHADRTQDLRNPMLRQGSCWTSSTSGWFSGFPSYLLTLFPHAEQIFSKHHKQNGQHATSWTLINSPMSVSLKSASLYLCWCPYLEEKTMVYFIRRKHY